MTVFSVAKGGSDMLHRARSLGEAHGAVSWSIDGSGYEGYRDGRRPPRLGERRVVKHDHYVDVVVYNAPPGTAEQLAGAADRRLR